MKLLLSSAGVTNQSIADALEKLVEKPLAEAKVGFVPTAANAEEGNKDWFFKQIDEVRQFGVRWIDMVDISAPGLDWRARMNEADVIFVSGGNTFHLLNQTRQTGFGEWLKDSDKVYVGVSAGSIIATPTIAIASMPPGDPNVPGLKDLAGLGLVNFEIKPHCNEARFAAVEAYAAERLNAVYALDDASAVCVNNGQVRVVSEGEWQIFEP